jgi:cytochrome c oxidase subunit 4
MARIFMEEKEEHHIVRPRTFVLVWISLVILTGVTILASEMRMGEWSMLANLLIASTKASLVLWFFMHLKYEKRIFKMLFLVPIATITIIIGMTFFDIWYR